MKGSRMAKVEAVGRSYESREIRLMLGYRQHMKDPTAIVINEHKHHGSIVFPLPE